MPHVDQRSVHSSAVATTTRISGWCCVTLNGRMQTQRAQSSWLLTAARGACISSFCAQLLPCEETHVESLHERRSPGRIRSIFCIAWPANMAYKACRNPDLSPDYFDLSHLRNSVTSTRPKPESLLKLEVGVMVKRPSKKVYLRPRPHPPTLDSRRQKTKNPSPN